MKVIDEGNSFKQSVFPGVAALKSLNERLLLFQSTVSIHSDFKYTP